MTKTTGGYENAKRGTFPAVIRFESAEHLYVSCTYARKLS